MKTGVRWPFLALLTVLIVAAAGKVWWIRHELTTKPGLAYDQDRVLLPSFLSPTLAQDHAARRAFRQGYATWQKAKPQLAQKPGTPLTAAVRQQWITMLSTLLIDSWKRSGGKGDDGEALLRGRAAMLDEPPSKELVALAHKAIDGGQQDKLVTAAADNVLRHAPDREPAAPSARQAPDLTGLGYPTRITFWLSGVSSAAQNEGSAALDRQADALRGLFQPGEQRLVLLLCGSGPPSKGLCDKEGIDPWVFHMLAGREQLVPIRSRAAVLSGDEPPDVLARRHLLLAWHLHPNWPEAATALATVAAYKPSVPDEARFWFDQAVAAQFDYRPAYDALREALALGKGGPTAMLAFGRECLGTGRLDTQVPDQVWESMTAVASREGQGAAINWTDAGGYDDLRRLLAKRLDQASTDAERATARARWTAAAWRYGQAADVARLLTGDGATSDGKEFARLCPLTAQTTAEWAAARLALGQAEAEADQAWIERRWDDAANRYAALAGQAQGSVARFVARRAAAARVVARLAQGQTVSIQPGADLGAWELVHGSLQPLPDGVVRLSAESDVEIRFAAPLRTPFTLSGSYRAAGGGSSVRPSLFLRPSGQSLSTGAVNLDATWPSERPRWVPFTLKQAANGQVSNIGGRSGPSGTTVIGGAADGDRWLALSAPEMPKIYDTVSYVVPAGGSAKAPPKPTTPGWHYPPRDQVWWDLRDLTVGPADPEPAK